MNDVVNIQGTDLEAKEYQGMRVVTFADIDRVHQRASGTASRNFKANRKHFIESVDFFKIQPDEIRLVGITRPQGGTPKEITLITESGYLMLVKSFTDDLAWKVQRELVNNYFHVPVKKEVNTVVRRKLTTDDYMEAARVVGRCRNNRLPLVLDLYEKAGFDVPKLEEARTNEDDGWERVKEILSHYTLREAAEIVDIPYGALGLYRQGERRPPEDRIRIIIEKLGGGT